MSKPRKVRYDRDEASERIPPAPGYRRQSKGHRPDWLTQGLSGRPNRHTKDRYCEATQLRRQSLDPQDLILAHAGAFDVCARGYKAAHAMLTDGALESARDTRYAGWNTADNQKMLSETLEQVATRAEADGFNPQPASGRQERLENIVNKFV